MQCTRNAGENISSVVISIMGVVACEGLHSCEATTTVSSYRMSAIGIQGQPSLRYGLMLFLGKVEGKLTLSGTTLWTNRVAVDNEQHMKGNGKCNNGRAEERNARDIRL
ncbi:hypothetical protein EXIGLDRAFT_337057 [Exidia glandulosa HHB12029]|uniref:Uncharacterized protein n=1 Tax=Exidia glandulosa HHB12029 TaxID=1314781 RepID=A0A165CKT7_EXIGL|nr:hypothetical protein EXIGLDRAFT_337057 [Exidia glandulosa HHB12029]